MNWHNGCTLALWGEGHGFKTW